MRSFALAAVLFVSFVTPQLSVASDAPPSIMFTATAVRAERVTAGGEVVFFGRSVRYAEGIPRLSRHAKLIRDDDRDGVVTWDLGEEVPHASIWTIVDYTSGRFAVAAPAGYHVKVIDLPPVVWRGGTEHVDISRDHLDVLLVRPRVGVWRIAPFEGGRLDDDGRTDANLRARLDRMTALAGNAPPPRTATPRDVLVIIDPRTLDVFARVAE